MTTKPRQRTPVCLNSDRNFDDLALRFARNIYGGLKGELRLAVLRRDFDEFLPTCLQPCDADHMPLRILDAGGGQGQLGLQLAACGHQLTLCDISTEMLKLAHEQALVLGLTSVEFVHGAVQQMSEDAQSGKRPAFDLVLCHSVLEWVADQEGLMQVLSGSTSIEEINCLSYTAITAAQHEDEPPDGKIVGMPVESEVVIERDMAITPN